ncbi:MAG TPA: hypothetical protein VHD84_01520 [Candidatus Saccharimonadales bacterium]|nr:hypothetical protein [Candidatus Saccharimonadales bacterium]
MTTTAELWDLDPDVNSAFAGKQVGSYVLRAVRIGFGSRHEMNDPLAREVVREALLSNPNPQVEVEPVVTAMERVLDDDARRERLFQEAKHPDVRLSI